LLELLELLQFVDLVLEESLSFLHLVLALFNPISQILHLLLEIAVDLVKLLLTVLVSVHEGLSGLASLLVPAKFIQTLLELGPLISPLLHLLVQLVSFLSEILSSPWSDIIVRVLEKIHLQLK